MADITRREDMGTMTTSDRAGWSDPWERMRELLRWDPFHEMTRSPSTGNVVAPAFDVRETQDAFVIEADLPGFEDKDVEITLSANRLTVRGRREHRNEDKRDSYYYSERSYGSFSRSFVLPEGAATDMIDAEMKSGVLMIKIPKAAQSQPRRIPVSKIGGHELVRQQSQRATGVAGGQRSDDQQTSGEPQRPGEQQRGQAQSAANDRH
jgi:HSP20 family protein